MGRVLAAFRYYLHPKNAPPVKGMTCGVCKMVFSLLPDEEVAMGSHDKRLK